MEQSKTGWCCPQCSRILSPYVDHCPYCGINSMLNVKDEEWMNRMTTGKMNCDNFSVTLANTEINGLSWRDWLDYMRTHNWILKEEN